ncbi:alpha/beta hydrolase [Shimia sp.]|uniref:alpha/beta hydrolase n=1 Tax=Shimia sp. TaxID=1954381 RepID=UPI003B8AEB51
MRTIGRFLGRLLLIGIFACFALYVFGPYEQISLSPTVTEADVTGDLDAYFAQQEAAFDDLTPGVEKRIVWFESPGVRTELAVVYVHGFSATSEEIRPVPDQVAQALEANLIYTRLEGHGRDGAALDAASVQGWANDVAEAMIVARRAADKVVVISTSTGGTMIAGMVDRPDVMQNVTGLIFVSPNFGINNPLASLLTLPAARQWVPLLAGAERSFEPLSDAQETYWTTRYPSTAVLQMAALVKRVFDKDVSSINIPALFWFSDADQVVDPAKTHDFAQRWGDAATVAVQTLGVDADPSAHVIAGDIVSPDETAKAVDVFVQFINNL